MFKGICSSPKSAGGHVRPAAVAAASQVAAASPSPQSSRVPSVAALRSKVRFELQGLSLSDLRKRAYTHDVSGELIDEVMDCDMPKLALLKLLVDEIPKLLISQKRAAAATAAAATAEAAAKISAASGGVGGVSTDAQSQLRRELDGMTMRELKLCANNTAFDVEAICDESEHPRSDLRALLLERLPGYREEVEGLKRHAQAGGIAAELIDDALSAAEARTMLSTLLSTNARFASLKVSQLTRRAAAFNIGEELVEDALDDYGRAGVVALLNKHCYEFEKTLRSELQLSNVDELCELGAAQGVSLAAVTATTAGWGLLARKAALVAVLVPHLIATAHPNPDEAERLAAAEAAAEAAALAEEKGRLDAAAAAAEAAEAAATRRAEAAAAAAAAKSAADVAAAASAEQQAVGGRIESNSVARAALMGSKMSTLRKQCEM